MNSNAKAPKSRLDRLSLLHTGYRTLLKSGRSYSAFEPNVVHMVEEFTERKEILDPMSGYGTLLTFCAELGVSAFCVEFNLPLYLWQVLIHPKYANYLREGIEFLLDNRREWPKNSKRAVADNDWFPEESKRLILKIYDLHLKAFSDLKCSKRLKEEFALSLLCPFINRLSCSIQGDIVHHIKRGGLCVYQDLQKDYSEYWETVFDRIVFLHQNAKTQDHYISHGDCRTFNFPKSHFSAFITSPPYPNRSDLTSMFACETYCLAWLKSLKIISLSPFSERAIGTNSVSGRSRPEVKSITAKEFLSAIENYKGKKKAENANRAYYLPYFTNYFADLESSCLNISKSLTHNSTGYIIVANNTARGQVIPVSQTILEIWNSLGFNADIVEYKESFHIGTKNPRARGIRAKHVKYTIKVTGK